MGPEYQTKLTTEKITHKYRINNTQYRIVLKKITIFWAQMTLASLVAISGPKKVSIFRAHPPMALEMDFSHQNHYVPHHIKISYINSYMSFTSMSYIFFGLHCFYPPDALMFR